MAAQSSQTQSQTNFQKVVDFNCQFGVLADSTLVPKYSIFDDDPQQVEFCLKLIREEIGELKVAIETNDSIEIIDAIADILYVVYGMCCRLGIDADVAFGVYYRELMIKLNLPAHTHDIEPSDLTSFARSKTNFGKSIDIYGHGHNMVETDTDTNIFAHPEKYAKQLNDMLCDIQATLAKLEQRIKDKSFNKTRNSLIKLIQVVYTIGYITDVDIDAAFDLVHQNNMSKLCISESDAQDSVNYYKDNQAKLGYDSPNYRRAPNNIHWVVFNESTKKILKSIKWIPVDLTVLNSVASDA